MAGQKHHAHIAFADLVAEPLESVDDGGVIGNLVGKKLHLHLLIKTAFLALERSREVAGVLGWPMESGHARVLECADTHDNGVKRAFGNWSRHTLKFQVDDGGRAFEVARAGDEGKGDVPLRQARERDALFGIPGRADRE